MKTNVSKDIVKNIYDDNKLSPKMRKDLINHLIGIYNKKENKKNYTNICRFRNEAEKIKEEYGGKIIPQTFSIGQNEDDEEIEDNIY